MNMRQILTQARQGRPDLAAMNLGASGFSFRALRVLVRYPHSSGERFQARDLYRLWSAYRRDAEAAYGN